MNQNGFLKVFSIVLFLLFAAVSCWATSESLHLLLSTWPIVLCYVVTVGFFVVASIGSKLIVDSLNTNVFVEKRTTKLIGGIALMLVFWLVCSMPTNTHTFLYRTVINDKVNTDISATEGYLSQIRDNTNSENQAQRKIDEMNKKVEIKLGELESEIMNEVNPGNGPKAKAILRDFAKIFEVDKIEPLSNSGRASKQARQKLCDAYRKKIYILRDAKAKSIKDNVMRPTQSGLKEVKADLENLKLMRGYIKDGTIDLNKASDIKDVCDNLNRSYNTIKKNKDFVNFTSESDEAKYTADSPITDTKRMISVLDVWKDFVAGKYKGYGFGFWIIISVLVDIAAFIFFDIAFKKRDY